MNFTYEGWPQWSATTLFEWSKTVWPSTETWEFMDCSAAPFENLDKDAVPSNPFFCDYWRNATLSFTLEAERFWKVNDDALTMIWMNYTESLAVAVHFIMVLFWVFILAQIMRLGSMVLLGLLNWVRAQIETSVKQMWRMFRCGLCLLFMVIFLGLGTGAVILGGGRFYYLYYKSSAPDK